jgi:hypothetical protein
VTPAEYQEKQAFADGLKALFDALGTPVELRPGFLIGLVAGAFVDAGFEDVQIEHIVAGATKAGIASARAERRTHGGSS